MGNAIRSHRHGILIAIPLALSVCSFLAVAGAGVEMKVAHRARSLQPGEVALLEIENPKPLRRIQVQAFGRAFPAFSLEAGRRQDLSGADDKPGRLWGALIGIDLDQKPGRYRIELSGEDMTGSPVAAEHIIMISGKRFATRQLTVDEKFVTPPQEVQARIKEESERVRAIFDSITPDRLWSGPFRAPVSGEVISEFGKRSIYNGQPRSPHAGIDFRGATGTPVRAPNAGRVVLAAELYYSGNTVILDHGQGLYSYFGHMSAITVRAGAPVLAGAVVGKIGATGLVTGPHLHWSVRLAGARVDPLSLVSLFAGLDKAKVGT